MAQSPTDKATNSIEQAINAVLEAENNAKQAVSQCEAQAELLLEQARQQAHRINVRTDNRITRIHQRCSRLATDEINSFQHQQEQQLQQNLAVQIDSNVIAKVVDSITIELTTLIEKSTSRSDKLS